MITLGLNGGYLADHDASCAIIADGVLTAAVEEERLSRKKYAYRQMPRASIREVISLSNIQPEDIDAIAYPWDPSLFGVDKKKVEDRLRGWIRNIGLEIKPTIPIHFVQHHIAHAWSGLIYVDAQDRASADVITMDGAGEVTSGGRFRLEDGDLHALWQLPLSSSPGAFYEAVTLLAGFSWREEGKAMGLAAYAQQFLECGSQSTHSLGADLLKRRMRSKPTAHDYIPYDEVLKTAYKQLAKHLPEKPTTFVGRAACCAAGQMTLEQAVLDIISECESHTIVFAGGTALNCSLNGKIADALQKTGQTLVVPPCASDTGIAIGAAAYVTDRVEQVQKCSTALLGRQFDPDQIASVLRRHCLSADQASPKDVSDAIQSGAVIGWFAGRAEIGPRALGARCIIARTDSERIRDRINVMKGRESWRPLAPAVTDSEFSEGFVGQPSPYMLVAAKVRPGATNLRGVTHVDGSARPQLVAGALTPYKAVIDSLGRTAELPPAVICTSFNHAGEPMVYSPEDALASALNMKLDAIAGDGWMCRLG